MYPGAKPDAQEATLGANLYPLVQRDLWASLDDDSNLEEFEIGGDFDGVWDWGNDMDHAVTEVSLISRKIEHVKSIRITLAYQALDPLLKFDLSTEESLCNDFRVAKTIFHELTHAVSFYADPFCRSPFFEEGEIAEVGYCIENIILGGLLNRFPIRAKSDPSPALGGLTKSWPDNHARYNNGVSNGAIRMKPSDGFGDGATVESWPVPLPGSTRELLESPSL